MWNFRILKNFITCHDFCINFSVLSRSAWQLIPADSKKHRGPGKVEWAHIGPFSGVSEPLSCCLEPYCSRKSTTLDLLWFTICQTFLVEEKLWKEVTQLGSPCYPKALLAASQRQWSQFRPKIYQISQNTDLVKTTQIRRFRCLHLNFPVNQRCHQLVQIC